MTKAGKRLTILSKSEIRDLYELPSFNDEEREFFFSLDDSEIEEMELRGSIESRVHFILQLGYFRYKSLFFNISFFQVRKDVQYILERYFPKARTPRTMITRNTRFDQQSCILKLLNYQFLDQGLQEELKIHLLKESGICVDPKYLFDKSFDFLNEHRISLPGYSTLQDLIGQTLIAEEKRLQDIIANSLPPSADEVLQKMLISEGKKMYGITILKTDARGFNTKEMAQEIKKKLTSAPLFEVAEKIIPTLEISEQNVCHYAYLVDYNTVGRLNELPFETVRLYLLCYIYYRFEKINDNLVGSFIYHTNIYKKAAKQDSKEKVYDHKADTNRRLLTKDSIIKF